MFNKTSDLFLYTVAARLVQSITEIATTTVEFLLKTGMTRSEADKVVNIIQNAFKKYVHAGYTDVEALVAAGKILHIYETLTSLQKSIEASISGTPICGTHMLVDEVIFRIGT